MIHRGRTRRGSGRRRLRELTRSVVDTMEILEEVRGKHSGVSGMSKALVQVVKLGLQTCLQESEDRGGGGGVVGGGHNGNCTIANASMSCNSGIGGGAVNRSIDDHMNASSSAPSSSASSTKLSGSGYSSKFSGTTSSFSSVTSELGAGSGMNSASGASASAVVARGSTNVFLEEGEAAAAEEEVLPLGVASVLWELECCAAQTRVTLMNLNEARPNHFGVFRAGVYVEEIRMLETKLLELVQQAAHPREEKNASLEKTVAAGIRNCVARLWWSRRAGENAESMAWEAFEQAFQADFGEQLPKTLDVLRKHITSRGVDRPPLQPPPAVATAAVARRDQPACLQNPGAGCPPLSSLSFSSSFSSSSSSPATNASSVSQKSVSWPSGGEKLQSSAAPTTTSAASNAENASSSSKGSREEAAASAAVAALETTLAESVARFTAANASATAGESVTAGGTAPLAVAPGSGGGGDTQGNSWGELVVDVDSAREGRPEGGLATRVGGGALGRGISRLLSSVRRELDGSGARGAEGVSGNGDGKHTTTTTRVSASRYEELTWTHGGLYEAFQALADPRRVVFSMGVVDDGPNHEGGQGAEGWADASPVVVQGLLGLSVQQVCCGGQHAAVLTDCGEIFTWGRGGFGRLGHGDREQCDSPQRIEALRGIPCVQVACGFAYTAAVTASGDLYTWGAGENGRLGLGDVEDRHTPSRVEGLHSKVKEVYAGSVHSCVLTREGTVYAFGKHEYTGHGDKEDVLEPRLISAFSGGSEALVKQISVGPGGYHTMALTCQGKVYAWGHNRVAQLGIGNSFTVPRNVEGAYFLPNPQLVKSLLGMNIVKVVAGWGHSAALTMDGQLYVCGRNYQGQLGLGSPQRFPQNERGHPFQADFCLIDKLQHLKIRQIACGGEHSVAVAENGEVWSFGAGQKGQLGHESTTRENFPRLVQALKRTRRDILHVACGNNCTLVLAGGVAFPSLFERTAAVIRGNPKLWADIETLGLLPPSVVDSLRTVEG